MQKRSANNAHAALLMQSRSYVRPMTSDVGYFKVPRTLTDMVKYFLNQMIVAILKVVLPRRHSFSMFSLLLLSMVKSMQDNSSAIYAMNGHASTQSIL